MSIVFHEAGLKCVETPCVAQTFVNHNARLFKLFVVGNKHFMVERPSIKNLTAGGMLSSVLLLVEVLSHRFTTIHPICQIGLELPLDLYLPSLTTAPTHCVYQLPHIVRDSLSS